MAVIKKYIEGHKTDTLDDLQKMFGQGKGSLYVVEYYDKARTMFSGQKKEKRHFLDAPILLNNGEKIVVCSEWGRRNIGGFIDKAKNLGFSIEEIKN